MRQDIHPEYREVLFHDTNADAYFVIGSTLNPKQTKARPTLMSLWIFPVHPIRSISVKFVK